MGFKSIVGALSIAFVAAACGVAPDAEAHRTTADELVATTGLPIAAVLAGLTLLEGRGLVAGVYGRYRPIGPLATTARSPRSY